jgi:hypothetical protein
MKLRRYCVTVMDNWTPTREFFTLGGALKHWLRHMTCAHIYVWDDAKWIEMLGEAHAEDTRTN